MTERVRRVAERIRQELGAIDRVVRRAGRAMTVARARPDKLGRKTNGRAS